MPIMSPIRPELGRQDWSAVARGGEAFGAGVGQGLASLGASIGTALKQKRALDNLDKLDRAIAANTTTDGTVDLTSVAGSFAELGGKGDISKTLSDMVGAGMISPTPTQEQKEFAAIQKREAEAKAKLAEAKAERNSVGYSTQADALEAAKESGASSYKVFQQGDGQWALSLEFGDEGKAPASQQVLEWTETQYNRLADAVESGDRRTAMNIAGTLGIINQLGYPAQWADLVGMYGDAPAPESPPPEADETTPSSDDGWSISVPE